MTEKGKQYPLTPAPKPSAGGGIAWLALIAGGVVVTGIAMIVLFSWAVDGEVGIGLGGAAYAVFVFGLFLLAVAGAFGLLYLLLGIFMRD